MLNYFVTLHRVITFSCEVPGLSCAGVCPSRGGRFLWISSATSFCHYFTLKPDGFTRLRNFFWSFREAALSVLQWFILLQNKALQNTATAIKLPLWLSLAAASTATVLGKGKALLIHDNHSSSIILVPCIYRCLYKIIITVSCTASLFSRHAYLFSKPDRKVTGVTTSFNDWICIRKEWCAYVSTGKSLYLLPDVPGEVRCPGFSASCVSAQPREVWGDDGRPSPEAELESR